MLEQNHNNSSSRLNSIPRAIIYSVVLVVILPLIMCQFGAHFGNNPLEFNTAKLSQLNGDALIASVFTSISGVLTHTMLEWTTFSIGIVTLLLAFAHYRAFKEMSVLIVGLAIFFASSMDVYHMLAINRMVPVEDGYSTIMSFTGIVARVFGAFIILLGVIFANHSIKKPTESAWRSLYGFMLIAIVIEAGLIYYMSTTATLAQIVFPGELITRPLHVILFALYAVAIIFVYPKFYKDNPSPFTQALLLAVPLQVFADINGLFIQESFDNSFNITHFIKITAYSVYLLGMMLDYSRRLKNN